MGSATHAGGAKFRLPLGALAHLRTASAAPPVGVGKRPPAGVATGGGGVALAMVGVEGGVTNVVGGAQQGGPQV